MLVSSLVGAEVVLSALRKHPSNVDVQEIGLFVLGALAVNGSMGVWDGGC